MHAVQAKSVLIHSLKDSDSTISRDALAALQLILSPEDYKKTEVVVESIRKKQDAFKKNFDEGMNQMRLGNLKKAEELLKEAEKKMYKDKEEFYQHASFERRKAELL